VSAQLKEALTTTGMFVVPIFSTIPLAAKCTLEYITSWVMVAVPTSVGPFSKPMSKPLLKAGPTAILATAFLDAKALIDESALELMGLKPSI
jgi:hypothetical protein